MIPSVAVGAVVDKTGHYFHLFIACTVVVASAPVFLVVSFCLLDRRSSQRGQPALPDVRKAAVDDVPDCLYSSVPTEGDKDKTQANGVQYITSL